MQVSVKQVKTLLSNEIDDYDVHKSCEYVSIDIISMSSKGIHFRKYFIPRKFFGQEIRF